MSSVVESPIQVHVSSVFSHSYYHQAGDPGRGEGAGGSPLFPLSLSSPPFLAVLSDHPAIGEAGGKQGSGGKVE